MSSATPNQSTGKQFSQIDPQFVQCNFVSSLTGARCCEKVSEKWSELGFCSVHARSELQKQVRNVKRPERKQQELYVSLTKHEEKLQKAATENVSQTKQLKSQFMKKTTVSRKALVKHAMMIKENSVDFRKHFEGLKTLVPIGSVQKVNRVEEIEMSSEEEQVEEWEDSEVPLNQPMQQNENMPENVQQAVQVAQNQPVPIQIQPVNQFLRATVPANMSQAANQLVEHLSEEADEENDIMEIDIEGLSEKTPFDQQRKQSPKKKKSKKNLPQIDVSSSSSENKPANLPTARL